MRTSRTLQLATALSMTSTKSSPGDRVDVHEHAVATEALDQPLPQPPRVPLGVLAPIADEHTRHRPPSCRFPTIRASIPWRKTLARSCRSCAAPYLWFARVRLARQQESLAPSGIP